jgi:hypothetical protein
MAAKKCDKMTFVDKLLLKKWQKNTLGTKSDGRTVHPNKISVFK